MFGFGNNKMVERNVGLLSLAVRKYAENLMGVGRDAAEAYITQLNGSSPTRRGSDLVFRDPENPSFSVTAAFGGDSDACYEVNILGREFFHDFVLTMKEPGDRLLCFTDRNSTGAARKLKKICVQEMGATDLSAYF